MIDRATVERITDAAKIEEVVSDFVTLRRAGVNFKGLCPFHDDRTPSFIVSPVRNYCKCFACGEGGNPVTFVMKHEQVSYPDALRYLARKYGIEVKEKEETPEERQRGDDRESMFILNEWARKWFRKQLNETTDGRDIGMTYLRGRGFRDDILEKFQLGYCPASRTTSLATEALNAGFQEKYIINTPNERDVKHSIGTGLAFKNDRGGLRDRFAGRVIWPIFTISGKVAGFGGRVLDAATKGVSVKYQNSPESIIYSKRRELYGLYQAKHAISREGLCYLVEGYTDVMAMHQAGVENVVASSGTALTDEQISLIHRLCTDIVVVYDGDAAGIKASQRGIDMLLRHGMNVKVLLLPDGEDPDSFSRKQSATDFKAYIKEHQTDFIKFKTSLLLSDAKGDPVALSRLANNIVQTIAVIGDDITRSVYVHETAHALSMQESLIANAVQKQVAVNREEWIKQRERERAQAERTAEKTQETLGALPTDKPQEATQTPSPTPPINDKLQRMERELITIVIAHGNEVIGEDKDEEGNPVAITTAEYIDLTLKQDGIELRDAMHRAIMREALDNVKTANFKTEKHFLNHPDQTVCSLAFTLISQLPPADFDPDIVLHIMADYKLEIVRQQLRAVTEEARRPELSADLDRYSAIMRRFMELKEAERKLSLLRGDRVIG